MLKKSIGFNWGPCAVTAPMLLHTHMYLIDV
jgi:hypothetical protein